MSEALTFVINVKSDQATTNVQKLSVQFKGLFSAASQIKTIGLVNLAEGIRNISDEIKNAITPGANFQQGIADLEAITGITGTELNTLAEAARSVGKESGLGAAQAVEAFKLLASNIDVSTIGGAAGLKTLQKEVITLSQAAGVDMSTAANTMSFAIQQFQLPVADAARVVNALGAGAKYGAAEIPDLAASLKDAGSVANQAGVSIESTIGAIEVLSQRGIKGGEAGTMLRNVLLKLQTEEIPGVDLKTQGLSGALENMKSVMNDTVTMEKIFGRENITAAQILISQAGAVDEMTKKVTGTNVAYEQAAIRTRTYAHTVAQIRAKIDDLKISIFNATGSILPFVEIGGQIATSFSRIVPALNFMKDAMGGVIGSIGKLITGLRGAKTAQEALNFAFTKNPIGLVITGVLLLGTALYALKGRINSVNTEQKIQNELQKNAADYIAREKTEVDLLFDALNKTNPQSKERTAIIQELNTKYPELLKNMNLEKAGAEEIAAAYREVVEEINRVAMAEAVKDELIKKNKEVLELEPLVKAEIERNKKIKEAAKIQNINPSNFGMGASSLGSRDIVSEKEQKKMAKVIEERDHLLSKAYEYQPTPAAGQSGTQFEKSVTDNTSNSLNKSLLSNKIGDEKDRAMSSISGSSSAIKNINITVESFIRENQNIFEQGSMNVSDFEEKFKQMLFRILNDANLITG
jgi:TP901 family phage tail tape measure protein